MIGPADAQAPQPDPALISLVARSWACARDLQAREAPLAGQIVQAHGFDATDVSRIIRLGHLSPDIIEAILAGRQRPGLTATTLRRLNSLPLCWDAQRALLGFSPSARSQP